MSFSYIRKHSTLVAIIAAAVIIIAGIAARAVSQKRGGQDAADAKPLVHLVAVKDFSLSSHTISANGTVESLQQVDLKSLATGKVTKINVKIGDRVRAGEILAIIDQSNAGAALTTARGALQQAQASYNRLLAGASNEDIQLAQVTLDNARQALENTRQQQDTSVNNAYHALLNTGLAALAGPTNSGGVTATVTGTYSGSEQGNYNISLYATGDGLRFQAKGLENAEGMVKTTPVPLGTKGLYIQFSSSNGPSNNTWTVSIPNTQAGAYVTYYNAYQSAVSARQAAVDGAQSQVNTAQAALDLKKAQARPADIQAAQAAILTAQGQVQAAQAAYDNTLIKAPFDGEVSALSAKFADMIAAGQKVASIVNQGGLQVKVFLGGTDLPLIIPGAAAQIGDNKATGTVTNIAQSVDAGTRTGETDIAVADPAGSGLTVGQNVAVTIFGAATETQKDVFVLPLQAVKLTPDNKAYVYILDKDNKAQEVPVTTGQVNGESVEVISGLSVDMNIVSNAYDVSAGDTVQIAQ